MLFGANAYGITDIEGMGLEHIVKQRGSAGSADPLNQRSTVGWKATKTAERLVEEYMLRFEHSSETYGAHAVSN
jgi:N4-gp56 family major capsid protein